MGVYAVCGVPGSGKTLYLLKKFLIPALQSGRNVYTNIEGLNIDRMAEIFEFDGMSANRLVHRLNSDEDPEKDVERIRYFYVDKDTGEQRPDNSIFIIDEAQNYFGSRDFKENFSNDLIKYITRHRHYGHDVVWATQVLESVDISFRRNTAITYALRRMEHLGAKNSSFVYVFDRCELEKKHLSRQVFSFDKQYFACYDSYVAQNVTEKRKSYNVLLHSPFVWLTLIVFGVAAYNLIGGSFWDAITMQKHSKKKDTTQTAIKETAVPQQQTQTTIQDTIGEQRDESLCWTKKIRMGGVTRYTLVNGVVTTDLGYSPCAGIGNTAQAAN